MARNHPLIHIFIYLLGLRFVTNLFSLVVVNNWNEWMKNHKWHNYLSKASFTNDFEKQEVTWLCPVTQS